VKKLDFLKTNKASTLVILIQILDKSEAVEPKYSKTAINTKVNGIKTKPMVKENFGIRMVITTRDTGKMERLKDMGFTKLKAEAAISETGITIYNTGLEKRPGQMDRTMKENITKDLNKAKVSTNTWTAQSTKEIGIRIK
jgi:hypothetical protein